MMKSICYGILSAFALVLWMCCMTSCGFGHACQKDWEGSYTRYSGDYPIQEHWSISINRDGTCSAVNIGSGFKNYTHKYNGTWVAVSDDVIEVNMLSEPYTAKVTRSKDEVDHQASKAQTRWKRDQVYRDSSKSTYRTTSESKTFYIRRDGATSFFSDGLDKPIMICK